MQRKNATFTVACMAIALFSACKKEKEKPTAPTGSASGSYTQLKTGNYWVYEEYEINDLTGTATPTGNYDSSYIEKDTLINGHTYFKKIESNYPLSAHRAVYLRDSLHYMVDADGKKVFSYLDFTGIFHYYAMVATDTLYTLTTKMTDKDLSVTVPAGTFATRNYVWEIKNYPGHDAYGTYRNINHRYAKDVGLVLRDLQYFSSSPTRKQLRLVRYHVN